MDATPPQRVDIAQIVGEFQGKTPRQARRDARQAGPPTEQPRRAREEPAGPWYVVIDEILEGRVTLDAWPWPVVNPTTGYLSFDLITTRRFTREAEDVYRAVAEHRRAHHDETAATRPLRIGDVFEVGADDVTRLSSWTDVRDHTRDKRAEARAALDAMATHPLPADKAEELERLARDQPPEPEPVVQPTSAQAAV
jgi:hypothetical protein